MPHMDVLWTGQSLYIVSGSAIDSAILLRYSYALSIEPIRSDAGFPSLYELAEPRRSHLLATLPQRLWVTYPLNKTVMMRCTTGSDTQWGAPFAMPAQSSLIAGDDISAIIHFNGDRIGVMWSDQVARKFYFSVHLDTRQTTSLAARRNCAAGTCAGPQ